MRKPPARRDAQRSSPVSIRSATGLAPSGCQARRSAFRKRTRLWLEYSSRSATPPASSARTISATPGGIFPDNGGLLERLCVTGGARDGRFAAIYAPFDLKRPFLGSLRRRNVSLTYCPFRRTWARQDPELSLVNVAKRVRSVCTEPSNCRVRGAAQWRRPDLSN